MRRRPRGRIVEAACGDVDELWLRIVGIRDGGATLRAECPLHRRRRSKRTKLAKRNVKKLPCYRDPSHRRGGAQALARTAMTNHATGRRIRDSVSNRTAKTSTL